MTQVHPMPVYGHNENPYSIQLIHANKNVTTICYYKSATYFEIFEYGKVFPNTP